VPGLDLRRRVTDVREDVRDALHVGDRLLELVHRGGRRVDVGIEQPGKDRLSGKVDPLRAWAGHLQYAGIGADRHDPTVENGHGLHRSEPRVDRDDSAVVKDKARRRLTIAAEVSMPRTIKTR
jgi:hypothetical protein